MRTKDQVLEIVRRLEEAYPLAECTLDYKKDYELLFSVRLAAQCTDARVNEITPALFARADGVRLSRRPDVDGMVQALTEKNLEGITSRLCNVFEELLPEEYREVFRIREQLLELGALNAAMSGSGPTVFGIFREAAAAKMAADALKSRYAQTYLAKPAGTLV